MTFIAIFYKGVGLRGAMAKALDSGIVVREFGLQSRYYVEFRTNTLEKSKNPIIVQLLS